VIRVVADTNIYVSAIVFGGTCEAVLALARAGIVDLCISGAIQRELRTVLADTFGWTEPRVREALAEVNSLTRLVKPAARCSGILVHDDDHRILECAIAAQARFLVTGDKRHFQPLKTFQGIEIVSPRQFLDLLRPPER
jgi:putative PIN family toxin of toxin-antitoxin system